MASFDIIVIFNCEELLSVIPGVGQGLLRALKKDIHWESILEELPEPDKNYKSVEQIIEALKLVDEDNSSIKVEIVKDIKYFKYLR